MPRTPNRRVLLNLLAVAGLVTILAAFSLQTAVTQAPPIDADHLIDRLARGEDLVVLDVRSEEEYAQGHVPGAMNIPHTQIADRLAEIDALGDTEIVLYCRSGRRAGIAAETLRQAGYERLLHLEGDMLGWQARQLPVVREPGS